MTILRALADLSGFMSRAGGERIGRMKARIAALLFSLAVFVVPGRAQTAPKTNSVKAQPEDVQPPATHSEERKNNSGPLTWISSDLNPKTVFWIQGRFVPVDNPNYQGDAKVMTILCSMRENECVEIGSTSDFVRTEQAWVEEYKPVNWDHSGILATGRSLDGCTDETLKIHFSPPSVILINSPVMPMPENCKKYNDFMDKEMGKKGSTIAGQMEQDELVPTRGPFTWADEDLDFGKAPAPVKQKKP